MNRSPPGRGHDADAAGQSGNRLFARRFEQTLSGKLRFKLLKGDLQRSCTLRFKILGDELKFTAAFVNRYPSTSQYLHAIVWTKSQQASLQAKHDHTNLSFAILQREVNVS